MFRGLSLKEIFSRIVFMLMALSIFILGVICSVNAIKWINRPFPGFLLNQRMVMPDVGRYHWTGIQAGLKFPDKILKANGRVVSSMKELEDVVTQVNIGEPIRYSVEKKGQVVDVTVPTMRFSWLDSLLTFGITFISGIIFMLIGLIVYVMKPDTKASWSFLTGCFLLSVYSIVNFELITTHNFVSLIHLSAAFFPAACVHFSMYFPNPQRFILKYPRMQIAPYGISLIIAMPLVILYPKKGFQIFFTLVLIYMLVGVLAILYPVISEYVKPVSVLARQRAKVVLIGATVALLIPILAKLSQYLTGSFLGMQVQNNFLSFPVMIFPASIAYAIARHNLFDVDVYIKRAVGYVIMTAIIVGAYALVSIPLNLLVGKYKVAQSSAFPILFTLGVILVFNPLRDRVQGFVDRVFFRKEYDYGEIIDKIGGAMTSLLDLGQILKRLVGTFMEDMFIDASSVMLLNPAKSEYSVYLAAGERSAEVEKVNLGKDDALLQVIKRKKRELTKYDVLEDPKYKAISGECTKKFETLHASLMVPLVFQDQMIGLLNLGEKKSGKFYNREDINLIRTLANQGAVAIENALMVEEVIEKERMEEELSIARDLQVSMLPAACPKIKGFEIAAYSVSAREVGGDFYDFIEMGENRVGMVVGDVTGKSVSGALVMSASRSVFRMLSEEQMGVGEIMMRANRRTKKDIKSGMFVALLYAVLNANDKSLSLCSAGQTQPIYWSSETGDSRLIETKGDTFPLGILEDAEYEETRLKLAPGDKVVLYTDGIVEAMSEQEEMFGFDRLLEVVRGAREITADALLKKILYEVNAFAGGAAQHDDLTIIVISAED